MLFIWQHLSTYFVFPFHFQWSWFWWVQIDISADSIRMIWYDLQVCWSIHANLGSLNVPSSVFYGIMQILNSTCARIFEMVKFLFAFPLFLNGYWYAFIAATGYHHILRHGDAYMSRCIGSSLIQVMASCLSIAKPLPESMLTCYPMNLWKWTSVRFESEHNF